MLAPGACRFLASAIGQPWQNILQESCKLSPLALPGSEVTAEGDAVYGKVKIAGHPMLAAFPVACYVGALAGFAVTPRTVLH